MNTIENFRIRKAFLLPLGLLLFLTCCLLVVCIILGQPVAKIVILCMILIPVTVLFSESARRHAQVDENGLTVFKLFRKKTMEFADVTAVETVLVRKRAYLTLCADDDFLILSNAYADFPKMVEVLLQRVPEQSISEETKKMAEAPPVKSTDIISCWLAVVLVGLILYIQLGGKFTL